MGNWQITTDSTRRPIRLIYCSLVPNIPREAYNYNKYTPIILAPINRSSTLILSEYNDDGKLGLKIHDLRIVEQQAVSSVAFIFRGDTYRLQKLKNEFNRVCDDDRCIGVSYFLRKIFFCGFSVLYAPKILKPKVNGTLDGAQRLVKSVMISMENENE